MIETTLGVEGMMCGMCEAHVNDAIRRAFDVASAKSDRRRNRCVVVSAEPLDEALVRDVIEKTGYQLTSVSFKPHVKKSFFGR